MGKINFNAGKSLTLGMPTKNIGVGGTDLGFLFEGGKQFAPAGKSSLWVGGLFGDTFDGFNGEGAWRSPVMMRTSNRDFVHGGIKWDNAVRGGAGILDYPMGIKNGDPKRHDQGCFSIIPNDAIQLPDNHYMGMGFRVKNWDTQPGNQDMCHTHSNTWFHSTEPHAETWEFAYDMEFGDGAERGLGYQWWNENREQYFQNATFLMPPGQDYVYVFGTPEGRYSGTDKAGVYLRRCHWKHLWERSKWDFWGFQDGRWQWGKAVWPTPILKPTVPLTPIGEINAQWIAGKVRLTYMDGALGAICRTADAPDGVWSAPAILVNGIEAGAHAMYAPSLHPWNTDTENAAFNIATWPHAEIAGEVRHYAYGAYTWTANINPPSVAPKATGELRSASTEAMTDGERDDYITALISEAADRVKEA